MRPHPAFSRLFASRLISVSAFSVTRCRSGVTCFSAMSWLICLYSCDASALKLSRVNPLMDWHCPSVRTSCIGLETMRTRAFHPDVPRNDDGDGHGRGPRYGSAMTPGERRKARMPDARALLKFVGNVAPRGTPWGLGVSLAIPRRCVVIAWWLACRGALVHDRGSVGGAWWRRVVPAIAANDGGAIVVVVVADLGPALPGIAARASVRSAFVCLMVSPLPRRASPRRVRSCGQLWRTTPARPRK